MNANDNSFKAHLYNNSQKNKSAFIEKVISENFGLFRSTASSSGKAAKKQTRTFLDEEQLKNLNTIFSNLTFETIKQTNDKLQLEKYRDKGGISWNKKSSILNHNTSSKFGKNDGLPSIKKQLSVNDILINNDYERSSSVAKQQRTGPQSAAPTTGLAERAASSDKKKSKSGLTSSMTTLSTESNGTLPNLTNSSQIVIHVCDEAKRLKQDFMCPRDLLVKEMKYFSYNLNINVNNSNGSGAHAHSSIPTSALSKKNLDEIDISVHCDINIFDWLMRYVKRNHPFLIEKTIASPAESGDTADVKVVNGVIKSYEPKLEINNCVSILLSSDFLIMTELVDKCIVFIAENLESVLQIQCVLNGISEFIIVKLAACISVDRLDNIYDKKDKLKTKLFQRKIEFLFDLEKYRAQFDLSPILKRWRNEKSVNKANKDMDVSHDSFLDDNNKTSDKDDLESMDKSKHTELNLSEVEFQNVNYVNFLHETENDASTLFRCKLCSKLMTKKQSESLKCQLAILNSRGNYIYLHVPDENFDMTSFLQLLKDKLKTWQSVYWFLWALIKHFKCKKCCEWFRLTEFNKCRLNQQSFCSVHDIKISNSFHANNSTNSRPTEESLKCTCIFINHVLESSSITELYSRSNIVTDQLASTFNTEQRLANYLDYILENLDKHNDTILHGYTPSSNNAGNELDNSIFFCDVIEDILKDQADKVKTQPTISKENSTFTKNPQPLKAVTAAGSAASATVPASPASPSQAEPYETSFFIDSITGKHISLLSKHVLNLIKIAQAHSNIENNTSRNSNTFNAYNISSILNMNFDLKTCLHLISQTDVSSMFNSLDTLYFSKTNRTRWDVGKMTRLNQDNQREDDLNRFRDLSSFLIKTKLLDEIQKPTIHKSSIASLMQQQNLTRMNSDSMNSSSTSPGGIYIRVENEWKFKWCNK